MKICIPAETDRGLEAAVYGHFGSAPWFAIVDPEDRSVEMVCNGNDPHAHGRCNPLAAIGGRDVQALVTGGIGLRALQLLRASGVKAYRSPVPRTVSEVVADYVDGRLEEIDPESACGHHGCH